MDEGMGAGVQRLREASTQTCDDRKLEQQQQWQQQQQRPGTGFNIHSIDSSKSKPSQYLVLSSSNFHQPPHSHANFLMIMSVYPRANPTWDKHPILSSSQFSLVTSIESLSNTKLHKGVTGKRGRTRSSSSNSSTA